MTSDNAEPTESISSADVTNLLPLVAKAVKLSQELPTASTPAYIYYNDFPQYKAVATGQSRKILSIVQNVFDLLDAKANILDVPNYRNAREKFSSIVDANDRLLERLAVAMDLEEDPSRKATQSAAENLVVAVQRKKCTSLEWLKSKTNSNEEQQPANQSGPDGLLRLLTSTSIRRPQSMFSTPPDNSPSLFRPKLKSKPNCIQPLADSLPDDVNELQESPHPYKAELEAFNQNLSNWKGIPPHEPLTEVSESNCVFVNTPELLDEVVNCLSTHQEIAVDLEHHNHRSFLGLTCLIQLSTREKDYILDAIVLRDHLSKLNEVFTDPNIVKIFHGCDSDLMWLQRDFGVYVVNLFDTGVAARVLQVGRYSLSYLLMHYVNVRTNKRYQLADWRIRPLPEELIEYARTDTHYLIHIAARMSAELQDRAMLPVALERCSQLCFRRYTKPAFDPLGYLRLYRQAVGTTFSHRQLYALEQLFTLRDSIARREDESVHYVLPNHTLKVISEVLPRESSGLFACCNPIPPLVRKYVHDLHKIILDARNRQIEELPVTTNPEEPVPVGKSDEALPGSASDAPTQTTMDGIYASPHDQSHQESKHTVMSNANPATTIKKTPSLIGQILGTRMSFSCQSSTNTTIPDVSGLRLSAQLMDPNRMLLTELVRLLSIKSTKVEKVPPPDSLTQFNQLQTEKAFTPPVASHNPSETLIRLNLDAEPNDQPPPPIQREASETIVIKDEMDSIISIDSADSDGEKVNFKPDEVVVLRDQMSSHPKRGQKRRRSRRGQNRDSIDSSSLDTSIMNLPDSQPASTSEINMIELPGGKRKSFVQSPGGDPADGPRASKGRFRGRSRRGRQ